MYLEVKLKVMSHSTVIFKSLFRKLENKKSTQTVRCLNKRHGSHCELIFFVIQVLSGNLPLEGYWDCTFATQNICDTILITLVIVILIYWLKSEKDCLVIEASSLLWLDFFLLNVFSTRVLLL